MGLATQGFAGGSNHTRNRRQANMADIRQSRPDPGLGSRPDSGLGLQAKHLKYGSFPFRSTADGGVCLGSLAHTGTTTHSQS